MLSASGVRELYPSPPASGDLPAVRRRPPEAVARAIGPREACGVCGVYGAPDPGSPGGGAAAKVHLGLYALQHRGQESAGVVASDGRGVQSRKGLGLLSEAIRERDIGDLPGHLAIGHVRYSTTGSGRVQNIQPLVVEYAGGLLAVAHNGNLTNARALRRRYEERGAIFQTSTDSEVIVHLMADPAYRARPDALACALGELAGAYAFVFLTPERLMAARDPHGFRPLCLGRLGRGWVVASETCALDQLGAQYGGEVEPGELVTIGPEGIERGSFAERPGRRAHCIFEHIYFARPDSEVFGESVHSVREALGRRLAADAPADADIVIAVPDSGRSAAMGYAAGSGLPLERGFIRNHYVGRTFIMDGADARSSSVELKLNVVRRVVAGRRVVVVDDSIVRGNTARSRLGLLRRAGAREIHLRVSCPPIRHPCYYGIDFPTREELIAANRSVEEIRDFIGVETLAYQTVEGLLSAVARPEDYCTACFTGEYPVTVGEDMTKRAMERS